MINENRGRVSDLDNLRLLNTPSNSGASTGQDPTSPVSDKDKVLVTSPIMTSEHDSEQLIHEFSSIPVIPATSDQVADFLPRLLGTADQPMAGNESDNAGDETSLKKHPNTSEMKVYRLVVGKKHMML